MKIGIDIDDTICSTSELVHARLFKFSKDMNLDSIDIMNDDFLKDQFFTSCIKEVYQNVEIKKNVVEVLNRFKEKGYEIFLITARNETMEDITKKWLNSHNVNYDHLIMGTYGEDRAVVCKYNHIDLMIDDDPFNRKKILEKGGACLLFDDKGRYDLKEGYATNWLGVESYIEGLM